MSRMRPPPQLRALAAGGCSRLISVARRGFPTQAVVFQLIGSRAAALSGLCSSCSIRAVMRSVWSNDPDISLSHRSRASSTTADMLSPVALANRSTLSAIIESAIWIAISHSFLLGFSVLARIKKTGDRPAYVQQLAPNELPDQRVEGYFASARTCLVRRLL